MGASHRTAARIVRYGVTAGTPNGYLAMDKFPGTGMVVTHSLNSIITVSAPGMACYVSGNHTFNGQEGVFPAHMTNPFYYPRIEYLSEYLARTMGKSLGIVSTADIEDATPAANVVHTGNRSNGTGICDAYLDEATSSNPFVASQTGLAVLMGGGRRWFLPANQFGSSRTAATDYERLPADLLMGWNLRQPAAGALDPNRDLIGDFKSAGFTYVDTWSALRSAGTPSKLLGLFAYGNMNVAMDKIAKRRGRLPAGATSFVVDDYRAPDQPMLDEMTDAALKVLEKNASGFVLMVEGAHIDKQAHLMDSDRVIGEVIEFDRAVDSARKFAEARSDTVVIVLADHECAGFSLIGAVNGTVSALRALPGEQSVTDPGTAPKRQTSVATYDTAAFPQYAILSDGYPETFDVDGKLLVGYGGSADRYEGWLTQRLPVIDSLISADVRRGLVDRGYATDPYLREEGQFGYFLRGQAVARGQAVHTASDIPVSALSPGSTAYQLFSGVMENTEVFFNLARAVFGGYGAGTGK
jgi:alkaline phosphatase